MGKNSIAEEIRRRKAWVTELEDAVRAKVAAEAAAQGESENNAKAIIAASKRVEAARWMLFTALRVG